MGLIGPAGKLSASGLVFWRMRGVRGRTHVPVWSWMKRPWMFRYVGAHANRSGRLPLDGTATTATTHRPWRGRWTIWRLPNLITVYRIRERWTGKEVA